MLPHSETNYGVLSRQCAGGEQPGLARTAQSPNTQGEICDLEQVTPLAHSFLISNKRMGLDGLYLSLWYLPILYMEQQ